MKYSVYVTLALALACNALPTRRDAISLKNGQDALALNAKYATLKAGDACKVGEQACVGDQFAQCVGGKFVATPCAPTTKCAALPVEGKAGTVITCDLPADIDRRIAATGAKVAAPPAKAAAPPAKAATPPAKAATPPATPPAKAAASSAAAKTGPPPSSFTSTATANNKDLQNSLTLDKASLATGFLNDGQSIKDEGQVPSLTSGNNFINFCAGHKQFPITNGQQILSGSCNPAPMGLIPSKALMPSSKFVNPPNLGKIKANTAFTIQMAIKNIDTGHFTNPQQNYYAAPQQLNGQGIIIGHSHVVIEKIDSLSQTTPTDPTKFAFFKGLNVAAVNGVLSTPVTAGLPAGFYRMASINAAANHQPALAPVAQHGSLDDSVYFTVV